MNIFIIALVAAISLFIGLCLGAAVGGGARADQEFDEYVKNKKYDL